MFVVLQIKTFKYDIAIAATLLTNVGHPVNAHPCHDETLWGGGGGT